MIQAPVDAYLHNMATADVLRHVTDLKVLSVGTLQLSKRNSKRPFPDDCHGSIVKVKLTFACLDCKEGTLTGSSSHFAGGSGIVYMFLRDSILYAANLQDELQQWIDMCEEDGSRVAAGMASFANLEPSCLSGLRYRQQDVASTSPMIETILETLRVVCGPGRPCRAMLRFGSGFGILHTHVAVQHELQKVSHIFEADPRVAVHGGYFVCRLCFQRYHQVPYAEDVEDVDIKVRAFQVGSTYESNFRQHFWTAHDHSTLPYTRNPAKRARVARPACPGNS